MSPVSGLKVKKVIGGPGRLQGKVEQECAGKTIREAGMRQRDRAKTGARIQTSHGATKGQTFHQGGTRASHASVLC